LVLSSNLTPRVARQTLPKQSRLSARAEFQKIYALGQRYDGRLMAAFLRKNDLPVHRLGVTASTKAIGKSVDRNRARRLLREVFRRSRSEPERTRAAIRLGHQRQKILAQFERRTSLS
jgi:ribonuclease P protein component